MISYKEQIEAVAPYANLNLRASGIIQRFFLEVATQAEKDELDEWLNESEANERLFDLLIMATRGGVGAGILKLINDLTKKEPVKRSRLKRWLGRIALGLLLLLVVDYLIPTHPLSKLVLGEDGMDFVSTTVEAGDSTRVVWLYPESTRVELQPHSKLGYSKNTYWYKRQVQVWGSASFNIAPSKEGPFKVKSGKMWISLPQGAFTLLSDGVSPVVLQRKP
ncbi:FecR domain-containing protein [Flavihumibacter fluvii]|uniref:FecR domain-containing protein n=1 Tax=Flavihumibacter fluvii TaxID=2838157 RepID=UPI001BDF2049|nr:FecR domain-containing protein [Flavihumibacter fluvii]ULQ51954.1 FecR domain-containing protein [Flavihumibacter fluvii]